MTERLCLVHYHEIGLKGKNRSTFESQLVTNLHRALRDFPVADISRISGYVVVETQDRLASEQLAAAIRRAEPQSRLVRLGDLTIDTDRAHVERQGREVVLSVLEYRLLLLFATNPGKLVTREMIRDALWDDAGTYIEENTLSVYIKRLRTKVEDDPAHPRLIVTVRGLGYKAQS